MANDQTIGLEEFLRGSLVGDNRVVSRLPEDITSFHPTRNAPADPQYRISLPHSEVGLTDVDKQRGTAVEPLKQLPSNQHYFTNVDPEKISQLQAAFDGGASVEDLMGMAAPDKLNVHLDTGSVREMVNYRNQGKRGARFAPAQTEASSHPFYPQDMKVVADHDTTSLEDMLWRANRQIGNSDPDINVETAKSLPLIGDAMAVDHGLRSLVHGNIGSGVGETVLGGLAFVPGEKFLAAGTHTIDGAVLRDLTKGNVDEAEQLVQSVTSDAMSRGGQVSLRTDRGVFSLKNEALSDPNLTRGLLQEINSGGKLELHVPEGTEPNKPDVVQRLTTALNDAGRLSQQQKAMYSEARSERLRKAMGARDVTSGETGFHAELAQLKGELPKVDFEGVRGQFSQEDVDSLFNQISSDPKLRGYEPITARAGLAKLLDGTVPTPSELTLLSKVFPDDFIKAALQHRSISSKLFKGGVDALNIPRALMASFDLSAPLRQGVFLVGRKEFYQAWPTMFKQFVKGFKDDETFHTFMQGLRESPDYDLIERTGVELTDLDRDLVNREEHFMSHFAEKIPVAGRMVRASERGYMAFLNKIRTDTTRSILKLSEEAGIDFSQNPKALTDIGSFVNNATGRGNLGRLNSSAPLLNGLFFSPRLLASRLTMLNPYYYAQLSPVVRKEAIKSLMSFSALAATILGIAKLGGASVETNPRSSDFAKIRSGNTRFDILGGFQQYIVLGTRLITNETKTTTTGETKELGKGFGSSTRLDVAGSFLRSKASPVASFAYDYLDGKNSVGQPFQMSLPDTSSPSATANSAMNNSAIQRFIPLFLQDWYDVARDRGVGEGTAMAVPALFGVGEQTFTPNAKKTDFQNAPPAKEPPLSHSDSGIITPAHADTVGGEEISPEDFFKGIPVNEPVPTEEPPKKATTFENAVAADVLTNQLGLNITDSGVRSYATQAKYYKTTKGAAPPGTSRHEEGNAVDVEVPSNVSVKEIVDTMEASGFRGVGVITKKHGTGPHWHIQWDHAE
jgi:hypothetical protein